MVAENGAIAGIVAAKHGIAYPWGSGPAKRTVHRLDLNLESDKALVEKRKKGQGGSIWYEDENGKLQKVTE